MLSLKINRFTGSRISHIWLFGKWDLGDIKSQIDTKYDNKACVPTINVIAEN